MPQVEQAIRERGADLLDLGILLQQGTEIWPAHPVATVTPPPPLLPLYIAMPWLESTVIVMLLLCWRQAGPWTAVALERFFAI